MVLGLGLGFIGKGICFCFDLLYTYHVFWAFWKKKKDWSWEQNWKTWSLELPEFDSDILIFCIRMILQPVSLLQIAYPGLTDMCRHL